jgi:two-component system chemotaxis response regulator CheB
LDAAVLIAQHMPAEFTGSLATRLDHVSAMRVHEGRDGEPVLAGHVYIAPGGMHMRLDGSRLAPVLRIESNAPRTMVAPSADILFASAAECFGGQVVAAVLTGMGRDGSEGVRLVGAAGGRTFVQDRETSVIYGMPQSALRVTGPDATVPLHMMASVIAAAVDSAAPGPARAGHGDIT